MKQEMGRKYFDIRTFNIVITLSFLFVMLTSRAFAKKSEIFVTGMKTEYKINPLGIDVLKPRLYWLLTSSLRGQIQTGYQILVSDIKNNLDADIGNVWNSGKIISGQSTQVEFSGIPLKSKKRYYWKVRIWDRNGNVTNWSDIVWWEMGLLHSSDWTAHWIGTGLNLTNNLHYTDITWPEKAYILDGTHQAALIRKEIKLSKKIKQARIFATARGLYYLYINGNKVGEQYFNPGWTDYRTRLQYQVYDVTSMFKNGQNVLGVILGHGWYAGTVAFYGMQQYGKDISLLLQLEIQYTDNSSQIIVSDTSWKTALSPIISNDMIHGESYDARLEKSGWESPDYKGKGLDWKTTPIVKGYFGKLVASRGSSVKVVKEIKPVAITNPKPGIYMVDMGQNFAGIARITANGRRGGKVQMRFGEIMEDDGTLGIGNLLGARQTDSYIFKGTERETYTPLFTIHGFRYIEITGFPGILSSDNITGIVLSADNPPSGFLTTSDTSINKLINNIHWSFLSNFTYVPTDCPQRIERQGWMGDAGLFAGTSIYMADMASYFTKWRQDIQDAQFPDGAFSDVSPRQLPILGAPIGGTGGGTNIWGDAGITIPWTMYQTYGDKRIILRSYESMKRWITYCKINSKELIRPDILYGDWLPPKVPGARPASNNMVNTAYFAYSTLLLSKMAIAIGQSGDADTYRQLYEAIKTAFNHAFITANGYFKISPSDTSYFANQTLYALGLEAGLFSSSLKDSAVLHLVANVRRHGCLTTGIVGTRYINLILSRFGYTDVAYYLLNNRKYPSWLNQVELGATTIGEHWGSFSDEGTSRNHVALGSIGEWMYQTIGGIKSDPDNPGFKHIIIHPVPGGKLTYAKAEYKSIYGTIGTEWRLTANGLKLNVRIPVNTTATVYFPTTKLSQIMEGNNNISKAAGAKFIRLENGNAIFQIGSGTYHFSSGLPGH